MFLGGLEIIALNWLNDQVSDAVAGYLTNVSAATISHAAAAADTSLVPQTLGQGASSFDKIAKLVTDQDRVSQEQNFQTIVSDIAFALAEYYYKTKERFSTTAQPKTEFREMEPCSASACKCKDYDGQPSIFPYSCGSCGHDALRHGQVSEEELDWDMVEWLFKEIAAEMYPQLENRDGDMNLKTNLGQIDTCGESSCPCWDFDYSEEATLFSRRCTCGHRWREHVITGQWAWIVYQLAVILLQQALAEED